MKSPDSSANFLPDQAPTFDQISDFTTTHSGYKHTPSPLRTLKTAFIEETIELLDEIAKPEKDLDELRGEIGDTIMMISLAAQENDHSLDSIANSADTAFATLGEFQASHTPNSQWSDSETLGLATMEAYNAMTQHNSPIIPLHSMLSAVTRIANENSISLDDAMRQTMKKISTKTRENHAIKEAKQGLQPTHTERYLAKHALK